MKAFPQMAFPWLLLTLLVYGIEIWFHVSVFKPYPG